MSSNSGSSPQATTAGPTTSGTTLSSPSSSPQSSPTIIPATTSSVNPSTNPTTSTPTPVNSSSTPQSSSQGVQPASSATGGSGSTSTSPAAAATTQATPTTSSYTTSVLSTFFTTDSGGSTVLVTSVVPDVVTTSITTTTTNTGSNNSHTGTIVGAAVGGVVGFLAILFLLIFCIRKRTRRDEFDGNFDPDRVIGHVEGGGATFPNVDLADEVTPFPQSYSDNQGSMAMRQYNGSAYFAVPSSLAATGQNSTEFYPSKSAGANALEGQPRAFMQPGAGSPPLGAYIPPSHMYGSTSTDWDTRGISPPPSTISQPSTSARAAKEREAMGRGGQGTGLVLATQPEAGEGSGNIVVHEDAGRAPVEATAPPTEIPPAYDSIRRD